MFRSVRFAAATETERYGKQAVRPENAIPGETGVSIRELEMARAVKIGECVQDVRYCGARVARFEGVRILHPRTVNASDRFKRSCRAARPMMQAASGYTAGSLLAWPATQPSGS